MTDNRRRFSRAGNKRKRTTQAQLQDRIETEVARLIVEHDPTVRKAARLTASRMAALIAAEMAALTQSAQRSLISIADQIQPLGDKFVAEIIEAARLGIGEPKLHQKALPGPAQAEPLQLAATGLDRSRDRPCLSAISVLHARHCFIGKSAEWSLAYERAGANTSFRSANSSTATC